MEVLGVAEAWVLGGDQGQLGQAGKTNTLNMNQIELALLILVSPRFSQDISYLIYKCAVREGANDGSVECGYGNRGGIPRI